MVQDRLRDLDQFLTAPVDSLLHCYFECLCTRHMISYTSNGREATVRVSIVDVFVMKNQWNTPTSAANPTRLDLLQPQPIGKAIPRLINSALIAFSAAYWASKHRFAR